MAELIGKIHPKGTMLLRNSAGEATGGKVKYELCYSMAGTPIITSGKTGKIWTINWELLLQLAVNAGIDEE